jgi:hypothetical protein
MDLRAHDEGAIRGGIGGEHHVDFGRRRSTCGDDPEHREHRE